MLLHPRVVAVGEDSSEIREAVCAGFRFLGLKMDPGANGSYLLTETLFGRSLLSAS